MQRRVTMVKVCTFSVYLLGRVITVCMHKSNGLTGVKALLRPTGM